MPHFQGRYESTDIILNDGNALDFAANNTEGYGLIPRDFAAEPYGTYKEFSFPVLSWKEIAERAEYNEKNTCRTSDLLAAKGFFDTNQSRTLYCWMHGSVNAADGTRILNNQPRVDLSAASAAAPANSFRNAGGYGVQALKWLQENGVATKKFWPANEISRSLWTEDAKADAKRTTVDEWEDLPNDPQVYASALVQNILTNPAFNWWSHLVCGLDPIMTGPESFDLRILNSHGQGKFIVLQGRKAYPSDSQCVRRVSLYGAN
jgi:hypothetical protein